MAEVIPFSNSAPLVDAVCEVLQQSQEPLTIPRIRERLPMPFRSLRLEELSDLLQRQVAANVLIICPKYRSAQDRYWDRTLREHAKVLLREALQLGPVSWSELRKKFPKYLRHLADSVLNEELAKGAVYRHPPASQRKGPRYALQPAEVRSYASDLIHEALTRLEQMGFPRAEAREAMMQLLQEEEWSESAADARRADMPATMV